MRARSLVLVAAVSCTGACTPFGSSQSAGSTSGADAPVTEEESRDGGGRAGGDPDGATSKSATIPDAPAVGCSASSGATFCDDFDSETDFTKWSDDKRYGPALLGFDSANFRSYSRGLGVSIAGGSPIGTMGYLLYSTSGKAGTITVDFDLFPDAMGDADWAAVLEVIINPDTPDFYKARLNARSSKLSAEFFNYMTGPQGAQSIPLQAPALALRTWAHVTFILELSADGHSSTFSVALPGLASPVVKSLIPLEFPSSVASIGLGLNTINSSQEAWSFSFDNVAITVR